MKRETSWKEFWEATFASSSSDYLADRGTAERDSAIDQLSTEELLEFVDPRPNDVVYDAGCGTGASIVLIHERVRQIIAVDFAEAAVRRAQDRALAAGVTNALITQCDIGRAELSGGSVDKVLCLSVFHYLTDEQLRDCLRHFKRVLRKDGILILHVKNRASVYLWTLQIMKDVLRLCGRRASLDERFRTFSWYCRELRAAGFEIDAFNSFNVLIVERMPRRWIAVLQRMELARRNRFPFNTSIVRRLGADLKLRARSTT